jgi:hypothetical protein
MSKASRETKKKETVKEPRKLTRKEIHKQFEDFSDRADVKAALKQIVKHKRSGLLKQAFEDETGLKISRNYVYRVLRGDIDEPKTVTIAQRVYKTNLIHTYHEEDEEEEELILSADSDEGLNVNFTVSPHEDAKC